MFELANNSYVTEEDSPVGNENQRCMVCTYMGGAANIFAIYIWYKDIQETRGQRLKEDRKTERSKMIEEQRQF